LSTSVVDIHALAVLEAASQLNDVQQATPSSLKRVYWGPQKEGSISEAGLGSKRGRSEGGGAWVGDSVRVDGRGDIEGKRRGL
jgi:hypothetical protein